MLKYISAILVVLFTNFCARAQDKVEMADAMRASGKIYVVVGVITIVFIGILIYLVVIDKKVSRLEKKIKEK